MSLLKFVWEVSSQRKFINDLNLVYYGFKSPMQVYLETVANNIIKNFIFN